MASAKTIERKLSGVAASNKPTGDASKDNPIISVTDKDIEGLLSEYVGLNAAIGFLEAPKKSQKERLETYFFDLWLHMLWENKTKPVNPRFVTHKRDKDDNLTDVSDCSLLFQVQFQKGGLDKTLDSLPQPATEKEKNKTLQQRLKDYLISDAVGLSKKNADALLNPITGEFLFQEVTDWAGSFNELLLTQGGLASSAATKIFNYLKAKPEGKEEIVKLPAFTREEQEALLVRSLVARIKEGFYGRVTNYCDTYEQLVRLIDATNPKLVMTSAQFATSDPQSQVWKRFQNLIKPYLSVTSSSKA
jgi:hypothetical protein